MGVARFLMQVAILLAVKPTKSAPANMSGVQTNPSATTCSQAPTNNCHCQCELRPDLSIADAVNALEDKMDQLIALVNTTTPGHSAPGISMGNFGICFESYRVQTCIVPCPLNKHNYFLPFSVAPIHSCKEKFDKDKLVYIHGFYVFYAHKSILKLKRRLISVVHGMSVLMVEIPP